MEEFDIESTLVEAIRNGDKTIEAKLGEPRFLRIQEDDTVIINEDFWYEGKILESLPRALEVKITQVLYFETFKELFEVLDFQQAIPSAHSVEDAVKIYKELYTAEEEREAGVIAFTFEPII